MRSLIRAFAACALTAAGTASADPAADVHAAFSKFIDAHSFRATVIDVKKGQQLSSMEFVAPDRYHMKTGQGPETYIVGDDAFMEVQGHMMKAPLPVGKIVAQYRNKGFTQDHGLTVADAGSENLEGEPTHAYTYVMTEPNKVDGKLWISDTSGYPVQMESQGSFMGVKTLTRVRYSDFNDKTIVISAPNGP
jgi:hypothetical protein